MARATGLEPVTYGLTEGMTWALRYTDGSIVKGMASCNNTFGSEWYDNGIFTTESADTYNQSSTGNHCWCRAISYTPLNGNEQTVTFSSWVYEESMEETIYCATECAQYCVYIIENDDDFRRAVFGIAQ